MITPKTVVVTLLVMVLGPVLVAAERPPLARIAAVESGGGTMKAAVRLEVIHGSFFNHDELAILTPKSATTAKLELQQGVDMLLAGDKVRVTLVFKSAAPDLSVALLSMPGKLSSYAAAQALLPGSAPAPPPPATKPAPGIATRRCPFTPAELQAVIGVAYQEGQYSEHVIPEGKKIICTYPPTDLNTKKHFAVTLIEVKTKEGAAALDRALSGKLVPIKDDKDGARWQMEGERRLGLHYTRGGTRTEVRILGGEYRIPEMQPLLLKLRRVP